MSWRRGSSDLRSGYSAKASNLEAIRTYRTWAEMYIGVCRLHVMGILASITPLLHGYCTAEQVRRITHESLYSLLTAVLCAESTIVYIC